MQSVPNHPLPIMRMSGESVLPGFGLAIGANNAKSANCNEANLCSFWMCVLGLPEVVCEATTVQLSKLQNSTFVFELPQHVHHTNYFHLKTKTNWVSCKISERFLFQQHFSEWICRSECFAKGLSTLMTAHLI